MLFNVLLYGLPLLFIHYDEPAFAGLGDTKTVIVANERSLSETAPVYSKLISLFLKMRPPLG